MANTFSQSLHFLLLSIIFCSCHGISQRVAFHQRPSRQVDMISEECEAQNVRASCVSGFSQRLIDYYTQYQDYSLVFSTYQGCTRRENGSLCIDPREGLSDQPVEQAFSACRDSLTSRNCSSECRDHIQRLVPQLGCCINSLYNVSETIANSITRRTKRGLGKLRYRILFQNDLWNRCGVQTVGVCNNYAELRADLLNNGQTFSRQEKVKRFTDLHCSPTNNIQSTLNNIRRESEVCYNSFISAYGQFCAQNSNGEFCRNIRLLNQSRLNTAVEQYCAQNATNCTMSCRDAMMAFDNEHGCCVNSVTNADIVGRMQQSRSRCDLQLPVGMCSSTIVAGAVSVRATVGVLMLSLMMFIVQS